MSAEDFKTLIELVQKYGMRRVLLNRSKSMDKEVAKDNLKADIKYWENTSVSVVIYGY